jgi:hypothetical protein
MKVVLETRQDIWYDFPVSSCSGIFLKAFWGGGRRRRLPSRMKGCSAEGKLQQNGLFLFEGLENCTGEDGTQ